jgi:hypothetical protein
MSQITIVFSTDNACFEDDWETSVMETLAQAGQRLVDNANQGANATNTKLRDINGNTIGTVSYEII